MKTIDDLYITSLDDMIQAVNDLGIVPFFRNSIPGFSIEEHCKPEIWFTDITGPWEWKGPVIRETNCAYGKFFEHKAAWISKKWFPDFANYRRDGYDFDARFDDELASFRDKMLFDLVERTAPVLSRQLKKEGNYGKDGNKGFDTIIGRLQAQCYVLISDFVYEKDKHGNTYGWGVAEYSTPEKLMGRAFKNHVYERSPEESFERVLRHLKKIVPGADERALRKFLKAMSGSSK